jgi:rhodanese-related sulfurtransferase
MNKISLSLILAFVAIASCLSVACSHSNDPSGAKPTSSPAPDGSINAQGATHDDVARINVEEAKKLISEGKAIFVDVRGSESYKMSHIKGALELDFFKLQAGDYKGLPKDKILITYCACPTENSSAQAAAALKKAGFKDPVALVGGLQAWENSGGEVKKAPQKPPRKG